MTTTNTAISRNKVVARIEQQIRLWNDDTVTMACADMLADIKQLPPIDIDTAMRDKCVEKVKQTVFTEAVRLGISAERAITLSAKAQESIESLTLEPLEPEKQ